MTKQKKSFKDGSLYYVQFYDHADGSVAPLCEVVGWLLDENEISICLTSWITDKGNEPQWSNPHEKFAIVKSCIVKKKELKL